MKYLAFLFCFYIVALTVAPCQDSEAIAEGSKQVSAISKTSTASSHLGEDDCPPLCSCTCCSVCRDFISKVEQHIIIQTVLIPYSDYKLAALPELALEIYQPPQIV